MSKLREAIRRRITPPLNVSVDVQKTCGPRAGEKEGATVVRVVVRREDDVPYAVDGTKIYVRGESETSLAVRDEIVNLARRPQGGPGFVPTEGPGGRVGPPLTGVEIVETEERDGVLYHSMRDMRNGSVVRNITRKCPRRLWRYAIVQAGEHPVGASWVKSHVEVGLLRQWDYSGRARYDLVQVDNGKLRVFYGVTEEGLHGEWARLLGLDATLPVDGSA
jgi:hypothetical protein